MKTGIHRQSVSVLGRTIALIATAIALGHAATAAESSPAEVSGPFYSSLGREFDASMNSFWRSHCLGQSGPGPKAPMLGGRKWWGIPVSASDSDWIELKLAWHHDPECLRTLGRWLREIPFDSNGYVWAAADGRQHLGQHTLWHNNADFINALWDFRPDGTGRGNFGNQEENGGTNPFIAYYEIMARLKHNGPEDAWARFQALMRDFARDQFHRPTAPDPNHPGERFKSYVLDLPEAGLPLMAVLHGFMGVNPDGVELRVQPALPPGIEFLGVTHLGFRGLRHTVETRAGGTVSIKTGTTPPMEQKDHP